MQMTGSGRASGFLFFLKNTFHLTHFLQVVNYILFVVNHCFSPVVKKSESGCLLHGEGQTQTWRLCVTYSCLLNFRLLSVWSWKQVHEENNADAWGVGFRPGSGRQFTLVCRAASGSGLKTCGPGRVVIFRPVENSTHQVWNQRCNQDKQLAPTWTARVSGWRQGEVGRKSSMLL